MGIGRNAPQGKYRRIWISPYQKACRDVDERTVANPNLYRKRQMMVEHPFGTIKRAMNGYYFLLRTMQKVRGEVALLFLAYNLKRAINIPGNSGLRQRLSALSSAHFALSDKPAMVTACTVFMARIGYLETAL
ncbi:MAG: transposase [Peptococcaceae bacterium]|nr:transposase [Peptococcaceae bacterium]